MAGEFYQAAYVSLQYHMGFFMQNKMMPSSRSNMHEIINMLKTLIWEQNARPTMNQVFTFKSAMHAQSFSQILSYNNNEKSERGEDLQVCILTVGCPNIGHCFQVGQLLHEIFFYRKSHSSNLRTGASE